MQLPASFIQSVLTAPGFNRDAFEAVHQSGEQVVSIRLNPAKASSINAFEGAPVPWCSTGIYLKERPSFTLDPLFHAGVYYVQEASSMFVSEALKQTVDLSASLQVLDLCAAPGGKSTLLQSLINEESLLVSNEVIKTRVNILAENICKWGAANVVVTNNDPVHFQRLPGFFDVMLVDAPCSGSGLFRKDPAAMEEWSEQNVALCSQRQQRILADALPALKEDGILIYATCSYSIEEDEAIVSWLCKEAGMESLQLQVTAEWGIVESVTADGYGYRFYPDKIKGEGFFIAVFRKQRAAAETVQAGKTKQKAERITAAEQGVLKPWLKAPDRFSFIRQQDQVLAIPSRFVESLAILQQHLYIKKAGINMGTIIRNELIPDHELAMSTARHPSLPVLEVDLPTAQDYLRRNDFRPDTNHKGWVLISWQQTALGWAKLMPSRMNNYYPREWRILNK